MTRRPARSRYGNNWIRPRLRTRSSSFEKSANCGGRENISGPNNSNRIWTKVANRRAACWGWNSSARKNRIRNCRSCRYDDAGAPFVVVAVSTISALCSYADLSSGGSNHNSCAIWSKRLSNHSGPMHDSSTPREVTPCCSS